MARGADTGNAHVRRGRTERSEDLKRADRIRIANDPTFKEVVADLREGAVGRLENLEHDGAPETDQFERELCRFLRTLKCVERAFKVAEQREKLADHHFRPVRVK